MTASPLASRQKTTVLVAAFLAWMFAGLEISLFVLVHRQMTLDLVGPMTPEETVRQWFAWFQAAFLLGAAAGGWLFGWLGDRLGRSRALGLAVLCMSLGILAASSVIFGLLDPLHPRFQVFAFLLGFVGITYFGWLPLFLPELFPTRVRSIGTGISFNTGRVVAAAVVLSAGLLLDRFAGDYAAVGFWSGMVYAVGLIVIWFVPRRAAGRVVD